MKRCTAGTRSFQARRGFSFPLSVALFGFFFVASVTLAAQSAEDAGAAPFDPFGAADSGDGFVFGFGDVQDATGAAPGQNLSIGGELTFSAVQFVGALDPNGGPADAAASSASLAKPAGKLRFDASGKDVDASLRLAVSPALLSGDPARVIDEAWVRLWIGDCMLEGGLMKVTWGKADSLSVLDVLNPRDLSDLTITDPKDQKIARPTLHFSAPVAGATFEAAWLPVYESDRFAWNGPWAPKRVTDLKARGYAMLYYGADPAANGGLGNGLYANYYSTAWSTAYAGAQAEIYQTAYQTYLGTHPGDTLGAASAGALAVQDGISQAMASANALVAAMSAQIAAQADADAKAKLADLIAYPEGNTLDWSQAGARITGTVGQVDLGFQYFWGFLPNPVIDSVSAMASQTFPVAVDYNRYHQVGADLAAVIFGLNARFEAGANLTDDFAGDDPLTYNPSLVWAAGFDRDLFSGVNLNAQAKGSYVLAYGKIDGGAGSNDVEASANRADTMIAIRLAQSLNRETVKWELAGVWSPENRDFAVAPSLTFAIGEAELKLAGRWFGGDEDGNLGQYADQSYAEVSLRYVF